MTTPNGRLTAEQFENYQHGNVPMIMEDRGLVHGDRLMILHIEMLAESHADLESDFSHELDQHMEIDFRFEYCGRCMDMGEEMMMADRVTKMTADLPDDLKKFLEDGDQK